MHRRLDRFEQPLPVRPLRPEPVLHHVDALPRLAGLLRVHARVALRLQVGADLLAREIGGDRDRERDRQARIGLRGAAPDQRVDHLLRRIAPHRLAAVPAVQHRGAREQQLQMVVDLGHRADRAARGAHRVGLVDRDGRRHAVDPIHRGTVHPVQELARVRRERLDVAPLALGVERVEHERALARSRHAGDDDQLAGRQVEIQVLQVVLTRAADADRGMTCRHGGIFADLPDAPFRASRPVGRAGESLRVSQMTKSVRPRCVFHAPQGYSADQYGPGTTP